MVVGTLETITLWWPSLRVACRLTASTATPEGVGESHPFAFGNFFAALKVLPSDGYVLFPSITVCLSKDCIIVV